MIPPHNPRTTSHCIRIASAALLACALTFNARADDTQPSPWRDTFIAQLHDAWRNGAPMPQLTAVHPEATLDDAYAIQRELVTRMLHGDSIGGFKAAGVGSDAPDNPTTGVIPASGLLDAKDTITIDLAADPTRHIETEIGYIVNAPITAPIPEIDTLKRHVRAVAAVVEVPGGPVDQKKDVTPADLVAWNINAKQLIIGAPHDPNTIDPDTIEITLTRDGAIVNQARGDNAKRGQWETLRIAVNRIIHQGHTIQPGHILSNGALGKILKAAPGHYTAKFTGLGEITFEVK
jgi:2-keto-4-pentenoate hydratase